MSELGKRTASAVGMLAVALAALWLGGLVFQGLCLLVGLAVLWEWLALVRRIAKSAASRLVWNVAGLIYISWAVASVAETRDEIGVAATLTLLASVWAVDIGAYFAGRSLGGPKLAPRISPAKTWSGLAGGVIAAALVILVYTLSGAGAKEPLPSALLGALGVGAIVALLAQSGDLFESWMKRRAGVKDSGSLIPGHGGVFDRVDGLLAVAFVHGVAVLAS